MRELQLLETLIFLLLFFPIIRPSVKSLWKFHGLVWFYPITLAAVVGIFPAYGFRPECIPLLIFTVLLNIFNFLNSFKEKEDRNSGAYRRKSKNPVFIPVIILAGVSSFAFYFAPEDDTALTKNARTIDFFDEKREEYFSARIYEPEETAKGLIMVIPPLADQLAVDKISAEISKNGFAVAVFLKKNLSLKEKIKLIGAIRKGTDSLKANTIGKYWENERQLDIEFFFSRLADITDELDEGKSRKNLENERKIFAVGYGAGGSALATLAGSPDFIEKNPSLRAIITIESRFWSLFHHDAKTLEIPENASRFLVLRLKTAFWFANLFPKKVNRVSSSPSLLLPSLFFASDAVTDARERDKTYAATLKTLYASGEGAALIADEGAGAFDYSDYPSIQPLISALAKGKKERLRKKKEYVAHTAKLITDFAEISLENSSENEEKKEKKEKSDKKIHFEKNEYWNFGEF